MMKAKSFFSALIVLVILGIIVAFAYLDSTAILLEDEINRQERLTDQAYDELVEKLEADTTEYEYTVLINPAMSGITLNNTANGISDAEVVLAIARNIRELNIDESMRVVLTRDSDTNPSEERRQAIADMVNPDIIISLETNYDEDVSKLGVSVRYDDTFYNYKLTNADLADAILRSVVSHTGTKAEGLYSGYKSIFASNIPTVTVEVGYFSNREEQQALNSDAYRENMALGILEGIQSVRNE